MMTASELADSILYALPPDEQVMLAVRVATGSLAKDVFDATLENGLPLRDATDFNKFLQEFSDAVWRRLQARAKKEAVKTV
jgi:hypothetical protein